MSTKICILLKNFLAQFSAPNFRVWRFCCFSRLQSGFPPESRFRVANCFFFNWLQFVNKKWIFYHFRSMKSKWCQPNSTAKSATTLPIRLRRHSRYCSIGLFGKLPSTRVEAQWKESHFRALIERQSIFYFGVLRKLFCFPGTRQTRRHEK